MGGLQRFFIRITPIIMLICCICFGITHAFSNSSEQNVTYLNQITENVGTQENPNNITYYYFDVDSYIQNANANILKRSINSSVNVTSWTANIDAFSILWDNGYNVGDVTMSIVNGLLLVVNGLITTINILFVPFRLSFAVLLTGISIMGININRDTPIFRTFNTIIDNTAIPVIPPMLPTGSNIYENTTWQFFDGPNIPVNESYLISVIFESNGTTYHAMRWDTTNKSITYIQYIMVGPNVTENDTEVYKYSAWLWDNYRTIHIVDDQSIDKETSNKLSEVLQWADQVS